MFSKLLKFEEFDAQDFIKRSKRREKYIGSDENWDKAEAAIIKASS